MAEIVRENSSIERDQLFSRNVFEEEGYRDHYDNLTAMIKKHLQLDRLRGRKVIDLACGYGWWGQALMEHGAEITFIDGREANLAAVRSQVPGAVTYRMNVETDSFPVPQTDLILCMGLLYHLATPRALV